MAAVVESVQKVVQAKRWQGALGWRPYKSQWSVPDCRLGSDSGAVPAGARDDVQKRALISIVDDERDAREAIEQLIQSMGYATASFQSADDFLNSRCIESTACLITDIQMPGRSGFDLHEQVVADGNHTPVIFVTAYPEAFRALVSKRGAAGFLTKPIREEALIECLKLAFVQSGLIPQRYG